MPHVKSPSEIDIAQLTRLFNKVAFSATSAPQLPVVRESGTQRVYGVDDFRVGARDTLRFVLQALQIPHNFSVSTRWGSGRIEIDNSDYGATVSALARAPNCRMISHLTCAGQSEGEFSRATMDMLIPGKQWNVEAELKFFTREFSVRQDARINPNPSVRNC